MNDYLESLSDGIAPPFYCRLPPPPENVDKHSAWESVKQAGYLFLYALITLIIAHCFEVKQNEDYICCKYSKYSAFWKIFGSVYQKTQTCASSKSVHHAEILSMQVRNNTFVSFFLPSPHSLVFSQKGKLPRQA